MPYHYWKDISPPPSASGAVETAYISTIGSDAQNPYYRGAIGIKLPFGNIDISAEVFHDSSMSSKTDRGLNGVAIRAQWFPFRERE